MSRELLFYEKPVALHRETHKDLAFKPLTDFRFSAGVNSVPVSGIEFFEASRDLPVLFNRDAEGRYYPLALLSLKQQGHDWVQADGTWRGRYIPAFIRRYPFALTANGTVCFDETCPSFGTDGEKLFADNGENGDVLKRVVGFLNQYDAHARLTREFTAALAEKGLLKPFNLQIVGNGDPLRLEGLFAVDEALFAKIDDATAGDWLRKGWLAWVYAHLHSLGALHGLGRRPGDAAKP